MPIGTVNPPNVRPDDEPLICVTINQTWLSYVLGALLPMKYPEYWAGTLEENRQARRDYGTLIDILMQESECDGMTTCCTPPYVIQRVNPSTGMIEISTNNGASWTPQPNSIPSAIIEPVPPVTSGVSDNKCDAVANIMVGVEAWITHVTNDFDTATDILAFASAVLEAILAAIVAILSLGTLTALEAAVLPLIGAACAAVFEAGKTAFIDYWTDDIKKTIRCALYNNIGDDGAFTDAQFSAYWNKVNLDMAGGIPKPLFIGFMSSIGRQGLNNMAASGSSSGSDCSDCDDCTVTAYWGAGLGTVEKVGTCKWRFTSIAEDTHQAVYVWFDNPTSSFDPTKCAKMVSYDVISGVMTSRGYNDCTTGTEHFPGFDPTGQCASQLIFWDTNPFVIDVTIEPC